VFVRWSIENFALFDFIVSWIINDLMSLLEWSETKIRCVGDFKDRTIFAGCVGFSVDYYIL